MSLSALVWCFHTCIQPVRKTISKQIGKAAGKSGKAGWLNEKICSAWIVRSIKVFWKCILGRLEFLDSCVVLHYLFCHFSPTKMGHRIPMPRAIERSKLYMSLYSVFSVFLVISNWTLQLKWCRAGLKPALPELCVTCPSPFLAEMGKNLKSIFLLLLLR